MTEFDEKLMRDVVRRNLSVLSPRLSMGEISEGLRLSEDLGMNRTLRRALAPGLQKLLRRRVPWVRVTLEECEALVRVGDVYALVDRKLARERPLSA